MAIPRSIPTPPTPPSFSGASAPQAPPAPTVQRAAPTQAPQDEVPFALEHESVDVNEALAVREGDRNVSTVSGSDDIVKLAESQGFFGLDLNAFGVLPTISLKEGQFQSGDGGLLLGDSFTCYFFGGKPKYVYKTDLAQNDPRHEIYYSFDQLVSSGGVSIKDKISKWEAAGITWTRKDYIDARIGIVRDQNNPEPMLALLSIPPTSTQNYTNLALQLMHWYRMTGKDAATRLVRVWKGPKVVKVAFPFHPIKFDLLPE